MTDDLRPIQAAKDAVEAGASAAGERLPFSPWWLPDPFECPECGAACVEGRAYDPERAAFHPLGQAPTWHCEACDRHFRRE